MTRVTRLLASLLAVTTVLMGMPALSEAAEIGDRETPVTIRSAPVTPVTPVVQIPAVNPSRVVEVRTVVQVRNILPDAAKNLQVVVPPTVLSRAGTQRVLEVKFMTEPASTRLTPAGIEATYKVDEVPGLTSLTFEQVYTVELLGEVQSVVEESIDARYLTAEAGIESGNQAIAAKALEVTRDLTATEERAKAIIKFVVDHLTYDPGAASRNKGALAGFQSGSGVCQEYAGLFVAMARANGIPARMVYGWARNTGLSGALNGSNRHVWAEYYDAEKGWVAVDPTFAEVQEDLLAFDTQAHIAQNWENTSFSASFGGRGLLSIVANQTLFWPSTASR